MTNEKRKQEAIKNAYGELYDYISNHIDLDGWCICTKKIGYHWKKSGLNQDSLEFRGLEVEDFSWRPKSLKGLEVNNNWIGIDENLNHNQEPEKGQYWTMFRNGFVEVSYYDGTLECYKFWRLNFTHYQQIIKPNLPIY
jgi:hypothetical protein